MATPKKATGTKSTKKKTTQKKNSSPKKQTPKETAKQTLSITQKNPISDDVVLWTALALSILLFISDLGFGGMVGNSIGRFFFGLFGVLSYIFPFVLLGLTFFLISNSQNEIARAKGVSGIFLFFFLSALIELMARQAEVVSPSMAYLYGYENKSGGGFFGAMIAFALVKGFGLVGAYVIDVIACIIALVLITEKSVFRFLTNKNRHRRVRADMRRKERMAQRKKRKQKQEQEAGQRQAELKEFQKKPRRQRTANGVAHDTKLTAVTDTDNMSELGTGSEAMMSKVDSVNRVELTSQNPTASVIQSELEKKSEPVIHMVETPTISPVPEPVSVTEPQPEPIPEPVAEPEPAMEEASPAETESPVSRPRSTKETREQTQKEADEVLKEIQNDESKPKKEYIFPTTELLNPPKGGGNKNTKEYLQETAQKLEQTLSNFGVSVMVTDVSCGPAVTRYELQPEMGVKVSRITNLADDIKLNLAATDIRIEAPIPGKSAVGIEVPNKETVMVSIRELMESAEFKKSKSRIAFAAGRDIGGNVIISDIAKMPHLLIAGSTGSGKSVCINTIIMSILFKAAPDEVVRRQWERLRYGQTRDTTDSSSTSVAPLLTALWNQNKYYNACSPLDENAPSGYDQRTPNGCVAVAMAMILYYYRYPLQGSGSHTNHTDYGDFFVDFSQQTYCYEAMTDQLSFYNHEVAKLIFHCGTAVDMMYGPDGSGAYSANVPNALVSYFGYNPDCEYLSRHNYTSDQWRGYLMEELDAGRPVYYAGCSQDGCHAFVCDGYDADQYFHFNFGWGGSANGYYVLSATENDSNAVGGYNHSQHIVRHIRPKVAEYPYYCAGGVFQSQYGTLEDGSGPSNYLDNTECTYVLTEDGAYRFSISVVSFETQADHDSLSFWSGHPDNGDLLLTLSGSVAPGTTYFFNTDSLYITFKTDSSESAAGWRLKYRMARHENSCNSGVLHNYHGSFSDGSGEGHYRFNADCFWSLYLPNASYIMLTFPLLDLAAGDRLLVYDRSTTPRTLVATYTEDTPHPPVTFHTNYLFVELITDNYLNADGFEIEWTSDYSPEGVEEHPTENLRVFPNPASTKVQVLLPNGTRTSEVYLYDIAGRLVKQVSCARDADKVEIDVLSLSEGVYILGIHDEGNRNLTEKLVVRH